MFGWQPSGRVKRSYSTVQRKIISAYYKRRSREKHCNKFLPSTSCSSRTDSDKSSNWDLVRMDHDEEASLEQFISEFEFNSGPSGSESSTAVTPVESLGDDSISSGSGIGCDLRSNVEQCGANPPQWLQTITTTSLRRRIIHDIVPTVFVDGVDFTLSAVRLMHRPQGILLIIHHSLPNFPHYHIIHDCSYTSSRCRCSFLNSVESKRRKKTNVKYVYGDSYLSHLLDYFEEDGYTYIKILIEGVEWEHVAYTEGIFF